MSVHGCWASAWGWRRWHEAAWLLGAALAVAVVVLANGLVFAMLSDARSINAGSALVAALGMHLLTLALWLVALLLSGGSGPGLWGRCWARAVKTRHAGCRGLWIIGLPPPTERLSHNAAPKSRTSLAGTLLFPLIFYKTIPTP